MDTFLQDLRFAARTLLKNPGFSAVAVLTLALGIGANTAIFSVIRSVLLRPLPYAAPERTVMLWNRWEGWPKVEFSAAEFVDYREQIESFEHFAAFASFELNLTGDAAPERIPAAAMSARMFDVLGVEPVLGRRFTSEEDLPGRDNVVLLGHGLWQQRYGGEPGIVGRTILLNGQPNTVVGVMPPGFRLPTDYAEGRATQVWAPLGLNLDSLGSRGQRYLNGIGLLRPGATVEQANTELRLLARRWEQEMEQYPTEMKFAPFAVGVEQEVLGDVRKPLLILVGAVGVVLLIACANLANLLLARADARRREMLVRTALGAGRGRILRQLLTESVLLSLVGGALGLGLASLGIEALVRIDPASVPRADTITMDGAVLGFTLLLALATGLLFGSVPALHAFRLDLTSGLREGGRGSTGGRSRQRLRRVLVAGELAFSVVLVVGAGLLIRSFWELQRIDLGFRPENVVTARLSPPSADYPQTAVPAFWQGLLERVRAVPGVESAGAASILPLVEEMGDVSIQIEGKERVAGENQYGDVQVATPGYAETMGLKLVKGRFFGEGDREGALPVAVVNRTFAESYWPGEDAIGKRFHVLRDVPEPVWMTVVGVVEDVKHDAVVEDARNEMYLAHAQTPQTRGSAARRMALVVKSKQPPAAVFARIREEVRAVDPNLPVADLKTMDQVVSAAYAQPRFTMLLLALFAGLALALAAVGIYGVISYTVTQRTHEMGVRMALGAAPRSVLRMVVGEGMVLALAGIGLGVVGALLLTRLLQGLVYGVATLDPATFFLVPVLLALVALGASYLPARRAAGVDPMVALRAE